VDRDLAALTAEEMELVAPGPPVATSSWLGPLKIRTRASEDGLGWARYG
jgi:hypothetical protein